MAGSAPPRPGVRLLAVAERADLDLLKGGYTGVAEFLYLHRIGRQPDALNADQAIVAAARRVGISLTLLPALYQHSHFDGKPATAAQHVRRQLYLPLTTFISSGLWPSSVVHRRAV
jgi:hypothetical protein